MRLTLNTFVYEVGNVPIRTALKSAKDFGFQLIDMAAYHSGDPTLWTKTQTGEFIRMFRDMGFVSSQLLLANTEYISSEDPGRKAQTMDYMKRCGEFQLELGGRQVLVCWGCGVHEASMPKEEAWMNSVTMIREYAEWCLPQGILVDLELDPHVYFVVNSLEKMAKMIEDVDMPNVFANVDIGHLCITREPPKTIEKISRRMLHAHISETDTFEHTNSIIGSGNADFKAYIDMLNTLGISEVCNQHGEIPAAGIEMGEPGGKVDDPDRWVQESLEYLNRILPELTL